MHNTRLSDSLNGNKGRQKKAGLEPVSGVSRMGHSVGHAQGLREGTTEASRSRHDQTAGTPRQCGGQASLSTFGVPGFAGRRAIRTEAPAQVEVTPEAKAPSPTRGVATSGAFSRGCVNFKAQCPAWNGDTGQRCLLCDGHPLPHQYESKPEGEAAIAVGRPSIPVALAMPKCWQPASAVSASEAVMGIPMTSTTPAPIRLRLSRERLGVFLALATIEQRSLEDVLADHVAETAGRLLRTRHELHLDPQDRADLNAYIDGIEAIEREEGESAARILTTPAMRQAAAAADERERQPDADLEEWDRTLPFGHVELAVALD